MESQNLSNVKIPSLILGENATHAIRKYLDKILRYEEGVFRDEDPEELHQMRVGMRRLRSAIIGFQSVVSLPKEAGEKNIGKIARILGKLRDLDVMIETLKNQYYPHLPPSEQSHIDRLLSRLLKQRKSAFKAVYHVLHHRLYKKVKTSLTHWLAHPQYQPIGDLPTQEVLADLLFPQISQLFLHPGWLIGVEVQGKNFLPKTLNLPELDLLLKEKGEKLHDLRKQAKRVRYLMSLFTEFYGEDYNAYLDDIKTIQECLGNLQDSIVLANSIPHLLKVKLPVHLPEFSRILAENRYQFWLEWQPLQAGYLTLEKRRKFHLAVLSPSSPETLEEPRN